MINASHPNCNLYVQICDISSSLTYSSAVPFQKWMFWLRKVESNVKMTMIRRITKSIKHFYGILFVYFVMLSNGYGTREELFICEKWMYVRKCYSIWYPLYHLVHPLWITRILLQLLIFHSFIRSITKFGFVPIFNEMR